MILVFGSINLDLIFPLDRLPTVGQTVLGPIMRMEPGGKGANQAVAAARDGARVVFAGAVGRDGLAEDALALMREAGVDLSRVERVDDATGCAAICVDPSGANQIAVGSGANRRAQARQVEDALLGPGTTVLVQMEADPRESAALIHRAHALGARTVLNLAPAAPFEDAALRALDVLVANAEEAAWLAARPDLAGIVDDLALSREAFLHRALGPLVVVTQGGDGVAWCGRDGEQRVKAHDVNVVDTTAAGDCFTGVFAAGLDRGLSVADAVRRANVAAGLCCTRAGTQGSLPWVAETDAALSSP